VDFLLYCRGVWFEANHRIISQWLQRELKTQITVINLNSGGLASAFPLKKHNHHHCVCRAIKKASQPFFTLFFVCRLKPSDTVNLKQCAVVYLCKL